MSRFLALIILAVPVSLCAQETWTLQRCIDHAYSQNLTIKQSELNVQLSALNKKAAVGRMLPSLNGSATHGYNWGQTIDPFTNSFATERIRSNSFGLQTGVNLFNGFQLQNGLKQAETDVEISQANLEKVRNDIALNVAASFLNILLNRELVSIAQRNLEATTGQVSRVQKLVNAGALPQGSLDEINAQRATDEANVVAAQNAVDIAELTLVQMLQLTEQESSSFEISVPQISDAESVQLPPDAQAAIQHALNNFPEVKSAEANLESAEIGLDVARGMQYPRLDASFSYGTGYSGAAKQGIGDIQLGEPFPIGYVDGSFTPVYTQQFTYLDYETIPFERQVENNTNQSLFFSLQIPIFNGFSTNTGIQRAKINTLSSGYQLEQTKQQLTQTVELAYADAKAALSNYEANVIAEAAAQKAFDYAEARFNAGAINSTEYNDARARLDNAKANVLRMKYDFVFKSKVLDFYQGKVITLN
ncbi:MAG: TolC family protein [Flavobacteriales bacterium]|nr:TolC family protein [Flavobacteriales bacterium]